MLTQCMPVMPVLCGFVTTQTLKTPEPFIFIPICLVMLSSIEAVTSNYTTAHVVMT